MKDTSNSTELHPLQDIDQVIHASARLMILTYLYVVESADYVFLIHLTGLSWGNLYTHLKKLKEAGYILISKEFKENKPHSTVSLTESGRKAFKAYKKSIQQVLDDLPD